MSEREKPTTDEDPDLLTDEDLDAVAGGIGQLTVPSGRLSPTRRPAGSAMIPEFGYEKEELKEK